MSEPRRAAIDITAAGARLQAVLDELVAAGPLPSCSAALGYDGEVVWAGTAGPVTTAHRYAIFSCSKAFVAATVWQLVDDGLVGFDTRVRDVLPGFGTQGPTPEQMGRVTVAHLLTHTAGFPAAHLAPDDWDVTTRRLRAYARWGCDTAPGESFSYHPVAAHWVLGDLIEALDGAPFTARVAARVTDPLGLTPVFAAPAAAPVRRPVVVGEVPTPDEWQAVGIDPSMVAPDEPEPAFDVIALLSLDTARAVGVPGGGGVATPSDVVRFYQGLLHDPGDLWSPATLRRGTAEIVPGLVDATWGAPANRTMGLVVSGGDGLQGFRGFGRRATTRRAFGHDGAGGQLAFADPDTGLSLAFATDGMDLHAIRQWQRGRRLVDAVFADLDAGAR